MVLQKDSDLKLLNTLEEKQRILREMGLDYLIVHPFTKTFSRQTALEFVRDILVNKLQAKKVVIGYDHRFGRNRNANIKDLINFGNTFDFEVQEIPAQEVDEVSVSSTKIRNALLNGDVRTANSYLGYAYMLSGMVVQGKGLGRDIGFPTANIRVEEPYKLIPQNGVYIVNCSYQGGSAKGMMNIGYNPTVNGANKTLEVHLFNVNRDLYNQKLEVRFLKKIRDEQKFESVQFLTQQLKIDQEQALEFLKNENR